MGEIYPEAFAGLLALVPGLERGGNLPAAYNCLLMSHHADLRDRAARSWCAWEERLATPHGPPKPSPRCADAAVRPGFARLVTHFFGQHAFLPPDGISGRIDRIADVPAVFVRGRLDIASPLGVVWRLAQQLPLATLHVVEDEDHGGADITDQLLVQATNRYHDLQRPGLDLAGIHPVHNSRVSARSVPASRGAARAALSSRPPSGT